jgi:dienelactone hydrolase
MKQKTAITFVLLCFVIGPYVYAGESVTFKGTSKTGDAFMLKGILEKPQGEGPFPAVVMLHGAAGMLGIDGTGKAFNTWAQRLAGWGYVSLQVDSFSPRGKSDITGDPTEVTPQLRAQDAHDAKSYLTGVPFVNRDQIALMGWSHGGWTVLHAIDDMTSIRSRGDPFRMAIAFYPWCDRSLRDLNAPLLILTGELDDWCPAQMCFLRMPSGKTTHEVTLKIYPQAHHSFDFEGIDTSISGHRLLYNAEAANDAIEQVKQVLAKYLK